MHVFMKQSVLVSKCFVKRTENNTGMFKDRVCPQSKNAEHDLCLWQYINILLFSPL